MHSAIEAVLLRIFTGEEDRFAGRPLYQSIVMAALKRELEGATVLRGPNGFGVSRTIRSDLNIDAGPRDPTIVEIVDAEDHINRFLPVVNEMMESGLLTVEKVRAIRYRRPSSREEGSARIIHQQANGPDELCEAARMSQKGKKMEVPHDAILLRIFTSIDDKSGLTPLYVAIVQKAREMHLAGATVLHGSLGFGQSAHLHRGHFFPLTQDLPVVIEIVDSEEKINAFLPALDQIMESGLVTLEVAKVLQYGRQRTPLLERIRNHFGLPSASS